MGVLVETVDSPEDVAVQSQATLHKAFVGMQAGALLLHQRLMPLKTFGKSKRQVP